jgi:hypothetical protein
MSIGNLKDSGNQGNNLPFQWKVLQGLQEIANQVGQPLTCVDDSVTICNDNIDAFTFTNILGVGESLNVNIANTIPLEVNISEANDSILVYGYDAAGGNNEPIAVNASGQVAIQDGGNSITVDGGTGPQRIATFLRPSGSNGTVGPNIYSASFASVGTANAIVGGINLKPGETLNFDAGAINNTLAAITYNTLTNSGAELIIITLT